MISGIISPLSISYVSPFLHNNEDVDWADPRSGPGTSLHLIPRRVIFTFISSAVLIDFTARL